MNFQEAEKSYKDLKAQHDAGKLTDAQFETEVGKLRLQDDQGRWWQIGVQTGEWYMHDGQKWNKAKPPAPAPAVAPVAPAPLPVPEPAKSAPPPPKAAATQNGAPKPDAKQPRASTMPRLFSAKPAGREGGLSRPMLIGIIAAVAVVILLILIGGYFLATNVLGTASAKPTSTPTRALAILPSPVPTRVPTVAATNTPEPPPTAVVTATAVLTTTAPTATRAPSGPTATRKPAVSPTPSAPKGSPTPNVPPGVYVMKLETDPAKLSTDPSVLVAFKATMFNNTGGMQTFHGWFVRVFQCPEQCTGDSAFKTSYGESLKADVNIAAGTSVIVAAPHIHFGPGRCDYIAIPYYTDVNNQAVQFQTTKGGGLYYTFSVCQ